MYMWEEWSAKRNRWVNAGRCNMLPWYAQEYIEYTLGIPCRIVRV